jgi:hypothetical protein
LRLDANSKWTAISRLSEKSHGHNSINQKRRGVSFESPAYEVNYTCLHVSVWWRGNDKSQFQPTLS